MRHGPSLLKEGPPLLGSICIACSPVNVLDSCQSFVGLPCQQPNNGAFLVTVREEAEAAHRGQRCIRAAAGVAGRVQVPAQEAQPQLCPSSR